MANATRTFKIGERCAGGIITAEIKGEDIHLINKQWDHSAGDRRSSDQSKAEEIGRLTVNVNDTNALSRMDNYLNLLTDSYHAEQVMSWVKSKVTLKEQPFWARPW